MANSYILTIDSLAEQFIVADPGNPIGLSYKGTDSSIFNEIETGDIIYGYYGNEIQEFRSVFEVIYHDESSLTLNKKYEFGKGLDLDNVKNRLVEILPRLNEPGSFIKISGEDSDFIQKEIRALFVDYDHEENCSSYLNDSNEFPLQKIFYGAPGTGKSHRVKEETFGKTVHRTTFHPDTDYAGFVGSYKPIPMEEDPGVITYDFIPQVFTNAYLEAWNSWLSGDKVKKNVCLVIEEINRGNCAQIFGDIFQLLDRTSEGYSDYSILPETDLESYIYSKIEHFEAYYKTIRDHSDLNDEGLPNIPEYEEGKSKARMCLPPNLSIVCTMNTSDQSLFPMDSAFKRRFNWEYIPIDYSNSKSNFGIKISDGVVYDWNSFLKIINGLIYDNTKSEDKQMGNFFVKGDKDGYVSQNIFISKVMYFLWNEVCSENPKAKKAIFLRDMGDVKDIEFTFSDLFGEIPTTEILTGFMEHHGIARYEKNESDAIIDETSDTSEEPSNEKWEHTVYIEHLIKYIKESGDALRFRTAIPAELKAHQNACFFKTDEPFWMVLSRNKDVNIVSIGSDNIDLMRKIKDNFGDTINSDFGIPNDDSIRERNKSRWQFTDLRAQAKLASPHVVDTTSEYKWFVDMALKIRDAFLTYAPAPAPEE